MLSAAINSLPRRAGGVFLATVLACMTAQAATTPALSADCGETDRVFGSASDFSVASDCRKTFTPPQGDPYDYRIYAVATAGRPAGDGPTLGASTAAEIEYYDLLTKQAGTGITGGTPANGNGQVRSSARLIFNIDGAQPGDVYALQTRLYVGGNWSFDPQVDLNDPYASFIDGYLQVRASWSGNFGTPVDGSSVDDVLYQYRADGVVGSGSLPNGVVTLERSLLANQVVVLNIDLLADVYLKNNFGTQDQNAQVGIGSGSFYAQLEAGVAGFQVYALGTSNLAEGGPLATGTPVPFTVTTDTGEPFVFYAPVPEPQSLALLLAGLGVVITRVRGRQRLRG